MILLDTNTLIHYIRGLEPVVRKLQLTSPRDLRIPTVVAYEVEYGAMKSNSPQRRKIAAGLLEGIVQVPFDRAAASETVRIRIDLEERGLVIGLDVETKALLEGSLLLVLARHRP